MRRVLFLVFVAVFAIAAGVAANSLTRKPTPPPETRSAPITKIAIQPDAPLSIGRISKATQRVLKVEIINVGDKTIRAFSYTNYKQCGSRAQPEGGNVWFTDPKVLKPGQSTEFDAGDDSPISDAEIEKCLQNPTEIRVQLVDVTFLDGSAWKASRGDFPGIKSSSP